MTALSTPVQLDLFSAVLHAYTAEHAGRIDNGTLYEQVAARTGIDVSAFAEKTPVGRAQQPHSLLARAVRWHQQTLKHAGVLERVEGNRGVWQLTRPASRDLDAISPGVSVVGFSTELGVAILGTSESVFSHIDAPITLMIGSPPYPLKRPRSYGNPRPEAYVGWIVEQLTPIVRNLVPGGSIALNISNDIFLADGARSLYRERLLIALHDHLGLQLVDQLVWHNPSKPPGPVRWASIERTHLNVAWEPIYWLTNDPKHLRSDNRRVLQAHSDRHLKLIQQGGEQRSASFSDGAYTIHPGRFGNPTPGKIPRNVLTFGHACRDQRAYKEAARAAGLPVHGAPMPLSLASFLVEFLSAPGDLVVDPWGGSFTSAKAAELLGRRWLSTEIMLQYVLGGAIRFRDCLGFQQHLLAA
ncbi:MAG: site-specific DNA-methyltransferase [Dechloromonas sp.]|nr:site-specific DNA-methyltransferase [Dechloromonas sp.]